MARRAPGVVVATAVAALLAGGVAVAGPPALEARLQPTRLGVEDLARLVLTVVDGAGDVSLPELGPLENFQVVSGPSSENHFSWVNGVATSSVRFTYLLQPSQVGPASVGAATVRAGGAVLTSQPLAAEIVAGSVAPPRRGRQVPPVARDPFADLFDPFADPMGRREVAEASLSLRQLLSDREVRVGEPIVATVVLDTTVTGIEGFEWVAPPAYPGWWAQRVELPEQISPELVERDGSRYHRYVVARHVLVPLKAGTLEVPAAEAKIGVRARSVFAPLQVVERATGAAEVAVAERPPAPQGYSGAVGDLTYSARLEPDLVKLGDSAVLTVELKGKGNLPLVEAPAAWPACAGCEVYPPEEEKSVQVDSSGIRGRRAWRTTVVPRLPGELRFEPVTLAVFDPAVGRYRQQVLGPLSLTVVAPPEPTPAATTPPLSAGGVEASGTPAAAKPRPALSGPPWLLVGGGVLGGALVGGLLTVLLLRRRPGGLPRRRSGLSPAERARELQGALESWWLGVRDSDGADELRAEVEELRKQLDAVRFAPGRADHSHTVADLEQRVRALVGATHHNRRQS